MVGLIAFTQLSCDQCGSVVNNWTCGCVAHRDTYTLAAPDEQ